METEPQVHVDDDRNRLFEEMVESNEIFGFGNCSALALRLFQKRFDLLYSDQSEPGAGHAMIAAVNLLMAKFVTEKRARRVPRIPRMINDIAHQLALLERQKDNHSASPQLTEATCKIVHSLLPFLCRIIRFLRAGGLTESGLASSGPDPCETKEWLPLEQEYKCLILQIEKSTRVLSSTSPAPTSSGPADPPLDNTSGIDFCGCEDLLAVLSLLAPERVPEFMFDLRHVRGLPTSLSFCFDELSFNYTTNDAIITGLLSWDARTGTMSMDPLLQAAVRDVLGVEKRQKAFENATVLLLLAFPEPDPTSKQILSTWTKCAELVPHVLSLKEEFYRLQEQGGELKGTRAFCLLLNACQGYLIDKNDYSQLDDLITVNESALRTLTEEDKTATLEGTLVLHRGQLLVHNGQLNAGLEQLKRSYEIQSKAKNPDLLQLSQAAEAYANALATANEFPEAIEWHKTAQEHCEEWPATHGDAGLWPAILERSFAATLIWANQHELAKTRLDNAQEKHDKVCAGLEWQSGDDYALQARIFLTQATLERRQGSFDIASKRLGDAEKFWREGLSENGVETREDQLIAACKYQLACAALEQGCCSDASRYFQDALDLMDEHAVVERARCLYKLSEALQLKPRNPEDECRARELRKESVELLRTHDATVTDEVCESTFDSRVNILWR